MNTNFPLISIQTKDQKVIAQHRSSHVPQEGDWLWIEGSDKYYEVTGVVTHLNIGYIGTEGLFKIVIIVK